MAKKNADNQKKGAQVQPSSQPAPRQENGATPPSSPKNMKRQEMTS